MSGHFEPLVPLARAAAEAGHDVAFATGEPVDAVARDRGFEAFNGRAGPAAARRTSARPHPALARP